jgi:lipid A ethanolaminephosphotransferase
MTQIKPRHTHHAFLRDRRTLIAGVALVYTALFCPSLLSVQPAGLHPVALAQTIVGSFVYSWAFFFTLRSVAPLFRVLTPVLFILSAGISYYMHEFRFEMTFQQMAVITEVQTQTALAFITWKLIAWVLLCGVAGHWLARRAVALEIPDPRNARLLFITSVLMLCIFTTEVGAVSARYFPYNLLFAVKNFVGEKVALARSGSHEKIAITRGDAPPVTVVLVVGESVRAANWGLSGYSRQTTPLLAKRTGLINFTDVTSCFPLTRVAVPCILTDDSLTAKTAAQHSVLGLFRELGFFTASIDMHGMSDSAFGSPVSKLLNDGNRLISFNGSFLSENNVDDSGVAALRGLLKEHPDNLFVFFHPFGSHWPYDTRYPERFRVHKPVCNPLDPSIVALAQDMSACVPEELVNAYDNSILYADYITNEVMESVKGRAALVLFTSDHGQSLGEGGCSCMAMPPPGWSATCPW